MAKTTTADNTDPSKMYSADVVAAVLAASGTTSLSMKQYEMMSALDGTRTASSFQHAFRAVLAKSKELKARVDNGEVFEPVAPVSKRAGASATASPAVTPKKRKGSGGEDGTPSRKKKATPKKMVSEEPGNNIDGNEDDLPADMNEFIKAEAAYDM